MNVDKLVFTQKEKEYIVLDDDGFLCTDEGTSINIKSKTIAVSWSDIKKISLSSIGGRGVVDALLTIHTKYLLKDVEKHKRSATFGFGDFINDYVEYRVRLTGVDNLSWIEVTKEIRNFCNKKGISYEGMDDENIEAMLADARMWKWSIFIFVVVVVGLLVLAKLLNLS